MLSPGGGEGGWNSTFQVLRLSNRALACAKPKSGISHTGCYAPEVLAPPLVPDAFLYTVPC